MSDTLRVSEPDPRDESASPVSAGKSIPQLKLGGSNSHLDLTPAPSRNTSAESLNENLRSKSGQSRNNENSPIYSPSRAASRQEHVDRSEAMSALEERFALLAADNSSKQSLIDRLIAEVDSRSDALRACGQEIVELRKAKSELTMELDTARNRLAEAEADLENEVSELAESQNLESLTDMVELRRRVTLFGAKYVAERSRNGDLMGRLDTLQSALMQTNGVQKELERLQRAHGAQSRIVQELQDQNAEIGLFRATIKTQEKVILKLEDLLEAKLRESSSQGNIRLNEELDRLRARNRDLEQKILDGGLSGSAPLEERIRDLEKQLQNAQNAASSARRPETTSDVDDALEKVKALEEQLVNNAKNFAREISEARMRIFELEAQME